MALATATLAFGAAPRSAEDLPHLRLLRTSPAADTTVGASPAEIRLFFSEPPNMRGTTVRLVNAAEALIPSTDAQPDAADAKQVFIRPSAPLSPGLYSVQWRVIAQDGHTQRGTFEFRVGAAPAP
jgi:methionine-rich copper-binding protein CopC